MKAGIICDNRQWSDPREPHRALAEGLERIGCDVMVSARHAWPLWQELPDIAFVWNGLHDLWGRLTKRLCREGVRTFIMERGFFDRFNHTQIDHEGFNHTASWSRRLSSPVATDAQARFVDAWGRQPAPMRSIKGYALVLLQVPGDSQLRDSEIHHSDTLIRAVEDATPSGLEIRLRSHPLRSWSCAPGGRAKMHTGTLADAVAGARFAITINSGSANEALAWGCPVLCLGPSLAAMAGAARQTSLADMAASIATMADGWLPANQDVWNYLYHLAGRQWSTAELADGKIMSKIIAEGTHHEL